jgi:MraZ protein
MIFTGHAELTIDAKQRLAIPAKHRALLNPERDGSAWYCVPWTNRRLMLYTQARFNELAEKGEATLTPREEVAGLEAGFFGLTERLEMDSAGRITIPRLHLDLTKIGTEVVMIGAGRRLEVWDRKDWTVGLEDRFASLPGLVRKIEDTKRNGSQL